MPPGLPLPPPSRGPAAGDTPAAHHPALDAVAKVLKHHVGVVDKVVDKLGVDGALVLVLQDLRQVPVEQGGGRLDAWCEGRGGEGREGRGEEGRGT